MTLDLGIDADQLAQAAIGASDEPLGILAQAIKNHHEKRVVDSAIPAHVFLLKWGRILNDARLIQLSHDAALLTGQAGNTRNLMKSMEAVALKDYLSEVKLVGSGS